MEKKLTSPFTARCTYEGQKNFDKYYIEREVKTVFKKAGTDAAGDEFGVAEEKVIDHKVDIAEYIGAQAASVGIEFYMKSLLAQGVDINECSTSISDKVVDYSNCPDTLAETMLIGDRAKNAFENLDPALKGNHTTIEGFLNSLSPEVIEKFYKEKLGVVDTPKEGD